MKARHALLLALAMAIPATSRAQVTSEPGVVIEATPIRIDPTAKVPLATLPRGMDVTVLAVEDGWLQVAFEDLRYGRRVGYVPRSAVSFGPPAAAPAAARVEAIPSAPGPAVAAAAPVAPASKQADTRATVPAAARPAATAPAASSAPAATKPAAAAAKRPARPPVQLVEADFPDLVNPTRKSGQPATATAPSTAAAASTAAATKPAARPPVRLVESEFPDLVTPTKKAVAEPAAREVLSIGDAFPDVAASASPAPAEANPPSRAVVSIGDAFPTIAELSAAPNRDAGSALTFHTVNNREYVSVDMGMDTGVFDARSTGVETIVARVLKQTLLPRIREYAKGLPPVSGAHGIYVRYRIPHHAAPQAKEYQLELVADMPHVVAFALAAASDEAFVDGSTLRVDGSDMRVNLRIAD